MPLQQKGMEAAGLAQLGVIVKQLEKLLPMFGVVSPVGEAVHSAIAKLSKHLPQGTVSPGMEQSAMQRLLEATRQQGPQIAAMRGAAPGGAPPGGMPPRPPGV